MRFSRPRSPPLKSSVPKRAVFERRRPPEPVDGLLRVADNPKVLAVRADRLDQSDAAAVDVLVFVDQHMVVGALDACLDCGVSLEQADRHRHQVAEVDAVGVLP